MQVVHQAMVSPLADYIPVYPQNSWSEYFAGVFGNLYRHLDILCHFDAPNVKAAGVDKRVISIMRMLKRYLCKVGLVTWSPEEVQAWFEFRKNREPKKSKKVSREKSEGKKVPEGKKQKKKLKRDTPGDPKVKPLSKQGQQPSGKVAVGSLLEKRQIKGKKKESRAPPGPSPSPVTTVPYVCGLCCRQYKNIRSYRTRMYATHNGVVPVDSSHALNGNPYRRAIPLLQPKPPIDQVKAPSTGQVPASGNRVSHVMEVEQFVEIPIQSPKPAPTTKGRKKGKRRPQQEQDG